MLSLIHHPFLRKPPRLQCYVGKRGNAVNQFMSTFQYLASSLETLNAQLTMTLTPFDSWPAAGNAHLIITLIPFDSWMAARNAHLTITLMPFDPWLGNGENPSKTQVTSSTVVSNSSKSNRRTMGATARYSSAYARLGRV